MSESNQNKACAACAEHPLAGAQPEQNAAAELHSAVEQNAAAAQDTAADQISAAQVSAPAGAAAVAAAADAAAQPSAAPAGPSAPHTAGQGSAVPAPPAAPAYLPYGAAPAAQLRPKHTYTGAESAGAAACFVLGFLFLRYVVWRGLGLGATLTLLAVLTVSALFLRADGIRLQGHSGRMAALCGLFSLVFTLTDNGVVRFFALLYALLLGAYAVFAASVPRREIGEDVGFDALKALFGRPFSGFGLIFPAAAAQDKNTKSGKAFKQTLVGLLIAVPLTLVVGALLGAADGDMQALLQRLVSGIGSEAAGVLWQLLLGIPVACYLFGMLYANAHGFRREKLSEEAYAARRARARVLPNLAAYVAMGPMLALYAVFFVLQAKYFLSAFAGVLPAGYSYADYARRGFFELCWLAVLNLAVLLAANRLTVHSGEKKTKSLAVFSGALAVFTLLLIATALSKMAMYITRFGLTRLRLYTSLFMVLLAAVFLFVLLRQLFPRFPLMKASFAALTAAMLLLCFSASDLWIAKFNISMYESGRHSELDAQYLLYELSDDARLYTLAHAPIDWTALPDGSRDAYIRNLLADRKTQNWHSNLPSWLMQAALRRETGAGA